MHPLHARPGGGGDQAKTLESGGRVLSLSGESQLLSGFWANMLLHQTSNRLPLLFTRLLIQSDHGFCDLQHGMGVLFEHK